MTTILVVDDEPDLEALILQRFRRQIRAGNLAFLFAHDGVEALDLVARHPGIDLALADLNMPRMDGLTLLGRLQALAPPLATVVVSAYSDMANIRAAMNRGAFDFLTKPIDFADLEVTVAKTLRHVTVLREARASAAELQRQREALQQTEKMAAFGSLLAGVAHELNNPLSIVLGSALMLREQVDGQHPTIAEKAERIHLAADRCARIVRSFLAMARQQAAVRRPLEARKIIEDALQLLAYQLRSDGIEVAQNIPLGLPPLLGDADQLQQVIANLLTNARQALEQRPSTRRINLVARADDDAVEITVADNGPGVSPAHRTRIFDPFFTTKPLGAGTGIGLAVSRSIAEVHGGSLCLDEAPGGGACFVLRVPRAPAEEAPGNGNISCQVEAGSAQSKRRALVVDDEPNLAGMLADFLDPLGYRCDLVATGRDAQRLLSNQDYDAILYDLRMPEVGGQALYGWLEENRPHLCRRIAFITGDTLNPASGDLMASTGRPVLEKPFRPDEVRRIVAELAADAPGER
ncbi:hybrid sensor histidine kinase/response regulator [Dankookia rubra]|uniref:hybrid sensor histidine kinase/response regulator n=1 Tax=Dankookia rubra TaxID=1442381 RepID=UPI00140C947D|nr:response regulator [Dankookia rubra]